MSPPFLIAIEQEPANQPAKATGQSNLDFTAEDLTAIVALSRQIVARYRDGFFDRETLGKLDDLLVSTRVMEPCWDNYGRVRGLSNGNL